MLPTDYTTPSQELLDQTYTAPAQISREYGIPPQTLNWHLNQAKLTFVRIGGHRMFFRSDWEAYLAGQRAKGNLLPKVNGGGV